MALFKQIFANDPNNPSIVATNGVISIFAPGTRTLLALKTVAGGPLSNPLQLNSLGFGPAFAADGYTQVAWEAVTPGQTFTGTFESYEGVLEQAVAAKVEAAEGAAAELAQRIAAGQFNGQDGQDGRDGSNVVPTAEAIAAEIQTPGTPANTALSATIAEAQAPIEASLSTKQGKTDTLSAIRLAAVGDSITACDNGPTLDRDSKYTKSSWLTFAALQSAGKISYAGNYGIPGQQSGPIKDRVPDVIAANPTHCVVTVGANDGYAIASIDATLDICEQLKAAGIVPLIGNRPPHGNETSSEHDNLRYQNEGLRRVSALNSIALIDFYAALTDPASGYFKPGIGADMVHPNAAGWKLMADAVLAALNVDAVNRAYIRTDNSNFGGELATNGLFYNWTSGTPDGWNVAQNEGGGTIAKVTGDTRFSGGNAAEFTAPGGADVSEILRINMNSTPGHTVEIGFTVHATGTNAADSRAFRLLAQDDSFNILRAVELRGANIGGHFTMRCTVPSNGWIVLDARVQQGAGSTTTHRVGNVSARNLTALGAA